MNYQEYFPRGTNALVKVLIADDELLVRVGLKTTVNWEENGFILVGEAQNGKEAIELFDKYNPDILITDIKMPMIDGLELIQMLQKKKKKLKSIILTHYDDFSYAHKAIKLGASEYILKHNLSPEKLLQVLKNLALEIESVNSVTERKKNNKNITNENTHLNYLLEKAYMSNISKKSYKDFIDVNSVSVKYPYFFIAFGKLEYNSESEINMKDNMLIKNLSKALFLKENIMYTDIMTDEYLILLFNIDSVKENIKKKQEEYIIAFRRNLKHFLEMDMIFGISTVSNKILDIPKLLEEGRETSGRYFFNNSKKIFFFDNLEKIKPVHCRVENKIIMEYMNTYDSIQLHQYIDEIFSKVYESYDVNRVKKVFINLISLARVLYYEKNKSSELSISDTKFDYNNFNKLKTFESIKKYVHDVYDFLLTSNENGNKEYSYVVVKSKEYIKNNYMRNISLEEVADNVQISKSYLSLLFKQETGINFSNFLSNYRVEQSKKFILETSYKIYEIAELVGFDNPYYFSRVFKDKVGMSCKEFKNKNYSK